MTVQGEKKAHARQASLPRIVSLADVNLDQHEEAAQNGFYDGEPTVVGGRYHSEALPATRGNSSLRDLLHTPRQVSFLNGADPRGTPVVCISYCDMCPPKYTSCCPELMWG